MWPFTKKQGTIASNNSNNKKIEQQRQEEDSDFTKWHDSGGGGETALPPTVTACASIILAIQSNMMIGGESSQDRADDLTHELWDCADNHLNSKSRKFKVLPEEAFMYSRFRPIDVKAANCIAANGSTLVADDHPTTSTHQTFKRKLVECVGATPIVSWTDRNLNEHGLNELDSEIKTLAEQVNSCDSILAPFRSAIRVAERDIPLHLKECTQDKDSDCHRDYFGLVQSKTQMDLKLTYKYMDICNARERTLIMMQKLLRGELEKNMLLKYEQERKGRKLT